MTMKYDDKNILKTTFKQAIIKALRNVLGMAVSSELTESQHFSISKSLRVSYLEQRVSDLIDKEINELILDKSNLDFLNFLLAKGLANTEIDHLFQTEERLNGFRLEYSDSRFQENLNFVHDGFRHQNQLQHQNVEFFADSNSLNSSSDTSTKQKAKLSNNACLPNHAPALWTHDKEPGDTPLDFINRHYKPWLGNGLKHSAFKSLDKPLFDELTQWLSTNKLPNDFGMSVGKVGRPSLGTENWVDRIRQADQEGTTVPMEVNTKIINRLARALIRDKGRESR